MYWLSKMICKNVCLVLKLSSMVKARKFEVMSGNSKAVIILYHWKMWILRITKFRTLYSHLRIWKSTFVSNTYYFSTYLVILGQNENALQTPSGWVSQAVSHKNIVSQAHVILQTLKKWHICIPTTLTTHPVSIWKCLGKLYIWAIGIFNISAPRIDVLLRCYHEINARTIECKSTENIAAWNERIYNIIVTFLY